MEPTQELNLTNGILDNHPSRISGNDRPTDPTIVTVASHGDVVLNICHETATSKVAARFRVHAATLVERSKYFAGLLQGGFGERGCVDKNHSVLQQQYGDVSQAPSSELPVIDIEDIGRISTVKSIEALCKDFLGVLHSQEMQATPIVTNLANLAIVADRFDALEAFREFVRRKKIIRAIDAKTTPKIDNALSEEKVRQRLLVGSLLDYGPWVEKYSQRMITKGWVGNESSITDARWWDLPSRLEEEMVVRRDGILETLQSVQTHFVKLFISRERQCRLGYDSSMQCDVFQLGQTIRFLSRIGTLQVQGLIAETEPVAPFEGDIYSLIDTLRQCPEYQIDAHHSHCGIRTKLLPLLNLITDYLQHIGVCAACWSGNRAEYAWLSAKQPLLWKTSSQRLAAMAHGELHHYIRTFFTASEREWSV